MSYAFSGTLKGTKKSKQWFARVSHSWLFAVYIFYPLILHELNIPVDFLAVQFAQFHSFVVRLWHSAACDKLYLFLVEMSGYGLFSPSGHSIVKTYTTFVIH